MIAIKPAASETYVARMTRTKFVVPPSRSTRNTLTYSSVPNASLPIAFPLNAAALPVEVGHRRNGAARRDRIAAVCRIVLADHLGDRLDIRFGTALDGVGQLVVEGDALLGVTDADGVAARGHVRRLFAVIGDGAVGKINRGALLAAVYEAVTVTPERSGACARSSR